MDLGCINNNAHIKQGLYTLYHIFEKNLTSEKISTMQTVSPG